MNIYVGNIPPKTSELQLRKVFERYGVVKTMSMGQQHQGTGMYNFCFVEMPFEKQAAHAVKELSGTMLNGHQLTVRESAVGA